MSAGWWKSIELKNKLMKHFALFALIVLILTFACTDENKSAKKDKFAILDAKIEGYSNKLVVIRNEDPFILKEDSIFTDESGSFKYKVELTSPVYLLLNIDGELFTVYFRPQDQLNFYSNIKNISENIRFSGSSAVYNNYLIKQQISNQKFQNNILNLFIYNQQNALRLIDSVKDIQHSKLNVLKQNFGNIDDYFTQMETKRVDYNWAYNRLLFSFFYKSYAPKISIQLDPDFFSFLNVISPNDSSSLNLKSYREFLDAYYYYQLKLFEINKDTIQSMLQYRYSNLPLIFTSEKVKNFMAFDIARTNIVSNGVKDVDEIDSLMNVYCSHSPFRQFIVNQFAKWNHLRKGMIANDFTFISTNGDSVKLSQFKGKFIYIDVWASWCKPCMEEVPALQKLQEKYSNKNIVFLSISVDQDKLYWSKFVNEKRLNGIQLFAGRSDMLYNYYLITGIPRFILIDDKGRFVESTAPSPRSGADKLISSVLK